MKKISILILLVMTYGIILSQPAGKWSTGGNGINSGDFIGTTNNFPFNFRTNNVQQMSLKTNGVLTLNSLSGAGNRFLQADANGNLISFPVGSASQVLLGDGTLGNVPGGWKTSGNDLFWLTGNVGIGTAPNYLYKLDVLGDAHISNNLYVGGGIVITDKVDATLEVKAGDVIVNNDLSVAGSSKFSGALTAVQGISLDNAKTIGISYSAPTGTNTIGDFLFAKSGVLKPASVCSSPTQDPWFYFGGRIQLFDAASNVALTMGSDGVSSSIDASGGGGLLVNYYCGKDIHLCKGAGGKVSIGNNLEAGFAITDLNVTANFSAAGGTKIALAASSNHTTPGGWNTKITVNLDGTKAIGVINGASGVEGFKVYGNGKTVIGYDTQIGGPHIDAMLTVGGLSGKIVAKSCYIRILNWSDYVFAPDYTLPNLYDIEKYYLANKHLEGVPTEKEVTENGVELGEMNKILLGKIEEMTILMVKQQKEIDQLKTKIK